MWNSRIIASAMRVNELEAAGSMDDLLAVINDKMGSAFQSINLKKMELIIMQISNIREPQLVGPAAGDEPKKTTSKAAPKNVLAKIVNWFSPSFFAKLELASYNQNEVRMIDVGSGGPSRRDIFWDKDGNVTMGAKDEPKKSKDKDGKDVKEKEFDFIDRTFKQEKPESKSLISRICAAVVNFFKKIASFFVRLDTPVWTGLHGTAWARLPANDPESIKGKYPQRVKDYEAFASKEANAEWELVSQKDEGGRADLALRTLLKQDALYKGNSKIEDCEIIDGGQRSVQGTCFDQKGEEFGGMAIMDMIKKDGLDKTVKYLDEKFTAFIPKSDVEKVPYFAGSHLYPLKDEAVIKELAAIKVDGKAKYDTVKWELGDTEVDAKDLHEVMTKILNKLNAKYTDAASSDKDKEAALKGLYGMAIANSCLKTYIEQRKAKVVRMAEKIIPELNDKKEVVREKGKIKEKDAIKASHYLGGAILKHNAINSASTAMRIASRLIVG